MPEQDTDVGVIQELLANPVATNMMETTARSQDELDAKVRGAREIGLFVAVEQHKGHWHLIAKLH